MTKRTRIAEGLPPRMVAEILCVHLSTVRRWIRLGHILAYRVGPQMVRIPRSEIARMRTVRVEFTPSPTSKFPTV